MGVRCSCGVLVDAFAEDINVKFDTVTGNERGNLTYLADVCFDTLETSTLFLGFVNTDGGTDTSFEFTVDPTITGTEINTVTCRQEGVNCVVTVAGTGQTTGFGGTQLLDFTAVFRDQASGTDNVQSFVITGFYSQTGAVPVPNGTITALGCF